MIVTQRFSLVHDSYRDTWGVEDESLAAIGEFSMVAWGLDEQEASECLREQEAQHGSSFLN